MCDTPTPTEISFNEEQIADIDIRQNEEKLRKRITRLKVRAYRESCHQKKIIESLKRQNRDLRSNALKQKIMLHNKRTRTDECTLPDLSPNIKVNEILQKAGVVVPDSVRKELLFGESVKKQLAKNFTSLKDHDFKQMFAKVVSGDLLKKYRVTSKLSMSKYFSTSNTQSNRNKSAGRKS
ncbi:unnamed protein product [Psylliodes chrysocephalus]|uniref:Uncharacterized protein n=1 Tax=Psylliodes chrysocephalus TaxID=3402493 RepID=A0A9P0G8X9_9CUCU|nr:unnamed protein product [Psylliodes chrysocephala]